MSPGAVVAARGVAATVEGDDMAERTCLIEGCGEPLYWFGWCRTHEDERAVLDAFNAAAIRGDECWGWSGRRDMNGYACICLHWGGINRWEGAHRVSWKIHNGPIPEGLYVCHSCDNPECVRPDHLWLGTPSENEADMRAKGRRSGRRLSPSKVREIRRRHAEGEETWQIAPDFNVSAGTVYEVIRRRTWSHVV